MQSDIAMTGRVDLSLEPVPVNARRQLLATQVSVAAAAKPANRIIEGLMTYIRAQRRSDAQRKMTAEVSQAPKRSAFLLNSH